MKRSPFVALTAAIAATMLTLADGRALAQGTGPTWYALDTQPPGTPASIQVDPAMSGGTTSSLILVMHGFYVETKIAPDGAVYQKLTVPGLGSYGVIGAPDLPAARLTLAMPQGMPGARLAHATITSSRTFPGMHVWPKPVPGKDDTIGTPDQFARNDTIYALRTPWPAMNADPFASATPKLGSIMGAGVGIFPFHWNPTTGQLDVAAQMQVEFDFDGAPAIAPEITRRRARMASALFPNWNGAMSSFYPINLRHYDGQYLIVLPNGWQPGVQQLIYQKSARGFLVALRFVPASGNTCESIRSIIQSWYASTPAEQDHYCLLVGEPNIIPLCPAPIAGNPPTDDLYGSMDGDDLDEEVYVGRLSAMFPNQVAAEVDKIIAYMDNPPISNGFKTALLVAHQEEAPGKYVGAHESVYNASYADRPNFTRIYGDDLLARNSLITYTINQGVGLVAYRGHGSSNSWAGWDGFESYSTYDVSGLVNGTVTPVVWNIACSNHDLDFNESMGEWWMLRSAYGGAVASYGATTVSGTYQNHELDRQLFKAVYDLGITTHSHAIQYAEAQMASLAGSENAWLYNLLGDPEMPIRRDRPTPPWQLVTVDQIGPCVGCSIPLSVLDTLGHPVPNLQISLWKPPAPPAPQSGYRGGAQIQSGDEVFDNTYTNDHGDASLQVSPSTPGWIYVTVQDDDGVGILDSIKVVGPTAVEPTAASGLQFAARPTLARGGTWLGFGAPLADPASILLVDVAGRTVRHLEAKRGDTSVRWAGDDTSGRTVPPGLYLARLETRSLRAITRVIVVR